MKQSRKMLGEKSGTSLSSSLGHPGASVQGGSHLPLSKRPSELKLALAEEIQHSGFVIHWTDRAAERREL